MQAWLSIGLLAVALGLLATRARIAVGSELRRGLVIGDSLTAHGGYVAVLERRTRARWDNLSRVGANTATIRRMAEEHLARNRGRYDVVVVLAGANDVGYLSAERTARNLRAIYAAARTSGAMVVGVQLTPMGSHPAGASEEADRRRRTINAWIAQGGGNLLSASTMTNTLADPSTEGPARLMRAYDAGDGLHLNSAGQRTLGAEIAAVVLRVVGRRC